MKELLKYLFPIMIALFLGSKESSVADTDVSSFPIHNEICQTCISACDSELCLPLQENISLASRLRSFTRKKVVIQKALSEFMWADKLISINFHSFTSNRFKSLHSSLSDPTQRLRFLNILII